MAIDGEDTLYGGVKVVYIPGLPGAPGSAAPETKVVAQHIAEVQAVSDNIASVNDVGSNISSVVIAATNIDAIKTAPACVEEAKKWAIGYPTEPAGYSSQWWAQHHGLVGRGIYSATTTYNKNEWVTYTNTGKTTAYVSVVDGNIGNPLVDTTKWMWMYEVTNGTGVTWGTIGGSLSSQTDLQNALNSKTVYCEECIWDTASAITAGTTITIPCTWKYIVGAKALLISMDGLSLYRGRGFEEVGTAGSQSNQIKILCDLPAGTELAAWTILSGQSPSSTLETRVVALENEMSSVVNRVLYAATPTLPPFPGSGSLTARIFAIETLANYLAGAVVYWATTSLPAIPGTGTDEVRVTSLESWVPAFETVVSYRTP